MKKVIIFNIFIIVLIIFIFELSLRFFYRITPQGISENIINTQTNGVRFNNKNVNKGKIFGKRIFTDENGFRITKNKKKDNGKTNIYFIGGSVTFGSGVEQSKTFSGILNNHFSDLNFINSSVMGSNLENNYLILKTKIKKENLEKIFINFSFDDIDNMQLANTEESNYNKSETSLREKLKNIKLLKKINYFIRSKSVIYVWTKGFLFDAGKHQYQIALDFYNNEENLNQMRLILDKIYQINQNFENKIYFLIIPHQEQIKKRNCNFENVGEKIILQELKKRNFNIINFKSVFCKDKNKEKFFLKFDGWHLSKSGHIKIANHLKKIIN